MNVYCILSDERVYRSKSPALFTRVMKRHGIKGAYVPFRVAPNHIGQALNSLRILHMAGANITVPFKEAVVPHLDVLSEGANIIGAINTIVIKDNILKGYNTNAIGIMDALGKAGFVTENRSAMVFGTGGAAKAAVFILNWLRTDALYVVGRSRDKAEALVQRFGGRAFAVDELTGSAPAVDLVINATSVSDADDAPAMARQVMAMDLSGCGLVLDLNYGIANNFWEAAAEKNGVPFMDGTLPLAHQARRTFALWTGMQLPADEFVRAIGENGGGD